MIKTIEKVTLVSVEQLDDTLSYGWNWRCQFVGCKGTLCTGESEYKRLGKCFIMLTDKKDFRLTTGYGDIEHTEQHITITTKSSRHIFKI